MCLSSCLDGCCQVCSIQMVMGRLDKDTVRLLPDQLWMKESTDLTLFVIAAWALEERNLTDSDGAVIMRIVLKRKLANELLTTFLPSVLLILITWATTFFKPFFFEAALSVNLTTMLVLTTIFMGVMQMLPSTAYIKMIDVWLIFCQLIPFTWVFLLTLKEHYRKEEGRGDEAPDSHHNGLPRLVKPELKEGDSVSKHQPQVPQPSMFVSQGRLAVFTILGE